MVDTLIINFSYSKIMFPLTLRQLQVFEKVATRLSYSRAAEELYMSQPAVSIQIKQLEQNVGLPLFEQVGKKIYLTEAGRELLQCSRNISAQLQQVDSLFDEMKGLGRGTITLAVVNTASYFAPRLIAKFCQSYPNINLMLQVANRDTVLKQLADNSVDLAIIGKPPTDQELEAVLFMDNPLVVIAPPTHPLAQLPYIEFSRLAKESFLSRELGSGTRGAMERVFAKHHIKPQVSMEMETNEAIKQAVQAGLGLGILSLHSLELELETGRLSILNAENFPLMRHWYVVHRSNKRISNAASAFKQFLIAEAKSSLANPLLTSTQPRQS